MPIHRFATITLAVVWLHGVLSGTDAWRLRLMYLATGAFCTVLVLTRAVANAPSVRVERFVGHEFDLDSEQDGALDERDDARVERHRHVSGSR
jgi:hypothetical protein